jgi:hypothetical protein
MEHRRNGYFGMSEVRMSTIQPGEMQQSGMQQKWQADCNERLNVWRISWKMN